MEELITAPLLATASAQVPLMKNMLSFLATVAYGKTDLTQIKEKDSILNLPIRFDRPLDNGNGVMTKQKVKVDFPLLCVTTLPSLLVDTVIIDFMMEVSGHTESRDENTASGESTSTASAGASYLGFSAKYELSITGSVSTTKENIRSSDYTARYEVHVEAKQQPPTEGMSKLLDILATSVEPMVVG